MAKRQFAHVAALLAATLGPACSSDAGEAQQPGQGGCGGAITGTGGFTSTGGSGLATGGVPSTGGQPGGGGIASGGGGAGGTASADSGSADAGPGKPLCLKDSSGIAMIGDSYVNWLTHTFPADINAASSLTIENFAIGGTSMGSGTGGLIPPQFDTALAKLPKLTTIIMDGGAYDVFSPDLAQFPQGGQCRNMGYRAIDIPDCQKIVDKAVAAATALFLKMAKSGVRDVVYFFYPKVPTNTLLGGNNPAGMLDYALPKVRAACEGAYELSVETAKDAPIRCHFVDLVPVFTGHPDYFALGDIHPSPVGSKAMAEAIWTTMKEECVGQPASSGCCAP
jgi:hypothetical protein